MVPGGGSDGGVEVVGGEEICYEGFYGWCFVGEVEVEVGISLYCDGCVRVFDFYFVDNSIELGKKKCFVGFGWSVDVDDCVNWVFECFVGV